MPSSTAKVDLPALPGPIIIIRFKLCLLLNLFRIVGSQKAEKSYRGR